jgi:TatD DNase family protein
MGEAERTEDDAGRLRLVDAHAHLQSDAFANDAGEVIAAARAVGVERLLVPAWDVPSTRTGIDLGRRFALPTSAGIHPHAAATVDEPTWAAVESLAADPIVADVGETGLDYDRGFAPRSDQLDNLRRHMRLALHLVKPLILHCRSRPGKRDAQDDLVRELREGGLGTPDWSRRFGGRPPGVLHSFSGPVDYAEAALEMGIAIAFGGLVFRQGEEASADVARIVPADRLLLETDAPFLKPRGVRGSRNEPRHVAVTAQWLLAQRGDDPRALGDTLVATFDRFVGGPRSDAEVSAATAP